MAKTPILPQYRHTMTLSMIVDCMVRAGGFRKLSRVHPTTGGASVVLQDELFNKTYVLAFHLVRSEKAVKKDKKLMVEEVITQGGFNDDNC